MSQQPTSILQQPVLRPAADFYQLRREGIGFIEQMGSRWWTDYNLHDPGITILEALCYAITDLAFRTGWDIKDLLAPKDPATNTHQAFFTARDILTVNPWTINDFRRLLIDLESVRNAWIFCKQCACDFNYYAWCEDDELQLAYSAQRPKAKKLAYQKVDVKGLYEVLIELEQDPVLGDLNDRKIAQQFTWYDAQKLAHTATFELRFPAWELLNESNFVLFTDLSQQLGEIKLTKISRSKSDNNFVTADELRRNWQGIFYVSFSIELPVGGPPIIIENASLRIFGGAFLKNNLVVIDPAAPPLPIPPSPELIINNYLINNADNGFIQLYRQKLKTVKDKIKVTKSALQAHRNLDEDYCRIQRVGVEDVAVCADVEVAPNADIERVQALIWLEIDRYFNPPIAFYSLQEMQAANIPVEEIFNGPALDNGFIKTNELEAAGLKTELRVSDIINKVMDIPGVLAVNNLLLTKYDQEGNPVKGAADLHAVIVNLNKISAQWTLQVTPLHQPRLYFNLSRFLFYKNGLPFSPRADEALDTLIQLRGESERPKFSATEKDLLVPTGNFRNPTDFYPIQYSFPPTFGIGYEGIPSNPTPQRQAKAKQLKAYLMVFEQFMLNATEQIAHVGGLFSLDPTLNKTYFTRQIEESLIKGTDTIVNTVLYNGNLQKLAESDAEFLERRNRFLDHLLARFGEQFGEYTLLLTDLKGTTIARKQLINDKIDFLQAYPVISRDRAKAFDYSFNPTDPANLPGLHPRISKLLGFKLGSDDARFIIVEHLLLRPKFPGDALYPACSDGGCSTCGDEDPYSFRLTFVMAGWSDPFNTNLDMRRFADRTIREETPAHLLPKICWIGNDGFDPDLCDPTFAKLIELLEADSNASTDCAKLSTCADAILSKYEALFAPWFDPLKTELFPRRVWETMVKTNIIDKIPLTELTCDDDLQPNTKSAIQNLLLAHFTDIAFKGWQFERFAAAWQKWLAANQLFDWTEERLQERVEAILKSNLSPIPTLLKPDDLCKCATSILADYGTHFYDWLKQIIADGKPFDTIGNLPAIPIQLCTNFTFKAGTAAQVEQLLQNRYNAYREVSYRLWVLLNLLGELRNTYPGATLHDCDDGSDENPVRLGSTALGNYKRQPRVKTAAMTQVEPLEEIAPKAKSRKKAENKPPKNNK